MEGTVTARDRNGNVLLAAVFSDLASRKALEIFIRALYGIQHYSTTITPADGEEDQMDKQVGHGEDDYWLPDISGDDHDDTSVFI